MKTYRGEWSASPLSLLTRGKSPRYLLYRRSGPQSRSGCGREGRSPYPYRESNPGHPSLNYALYLTELTKFVCFKIFIRPLVFGREFTEDALLSISVDAKAWNRHINSRMPDWYLPVTISGKSFIKLTVSWNQGLWRAPNHISNVRADYKWCERLYKSVGKNRSHHL